MIAQQVHFDREKVGLKEVEVGKPGPGEVLIRAEYSALSIGTEMAWIRESRTSGNPLPADLGYSLVGVVEEVGVGAAYGPGQRVLALAPHASAVITDGSDAALTPVPEGLEPAVASLGTLASVGLHAVERARVNLGESAVVFGYGLVGSFVAQLLGASGAGLVVVIEPEERRRQLARKLGADHAVGPDLSALRKLLAAAGYPDGADLTMEVAGHPSVFPDCLEVLRVGGRLVCTSTFHDGLPVTLYPAIVEQELTVIGAHQPKCPPAPVPYYPYSQRQNRRLGLAMMLKGTLRAEELITHRVPWWEAPSLYERLEKGDRTVLGAVLEWRAEGGG